MAASNTRGSIQYYVLSITYFLWCFAKILCRLIRNTYYFIHTTAVIYLDYASTTPLDSRVYEVMLPYLQSVWGNPSSPHAKGREARAALDESRQSVATVFGVQQQEVIFLSSGSEANTLAIKGTCETWMKKEGKPGTVISSLIEHKATLGTLAALETAGWNIVYLPVDSTGSIDPKDVADGITTDTALVTLQWVNNEIGTIQPIEDIHAICREQSVPLHVDAMQAIGHLPLPSPLPDFISLAAHKFYGPKGCAALIASDKYELQAQVYGGGQEFGIRSGTENVPGIVGLSHALQLAMSEQPENQKRELELAEKFAADICSLDSVSLNGTAEQKVANIININCQGHTGETLVMKLDLEGFCVSTGSACTTGSAEPSHVLRAIGQNEAQARENLRISFGKFTTAEELTAFYTSLASVLAS